MERRHFQASAQKPCAVLERLLTVLTATDVDALRRSGTPA
jgi:hypothetical protein